MSDFKNIHKSKKTLKMSMEAVQKDGMLLEFVPVEHKTRDVCLAAVKQNGNAFEFVPDKLKQDREIGDESDFQLINAGYSESDEENVPEEYPRYS